MNWEIEKIINVANGLQRTGTTGASTGEWIAAAFYSKHPATLRIVFGSNAIEQTPKERSAAYRLFNITLIKFAPLTQVPVVDSAQDRMEQVKREVWCVKSEPWVGKAKPSLPPQR